MTILVDSNILIYALNHSSPKHATAQDFLRDHSSNFVLAHQNILETLRILTHSKFPHPMSPAAALAAITGITETMQVITPSHRTHAVFLAFMKKHQLAGRNIFDAYLAATALSVGITKIATDNTKDFHRFDELKLINPFQVK